LRLSICVPTFNRAKELSNLLQSIPPESSVEVVICDDGSTDNTEEVINKFKNILTINYFFQENKGRSIAIVKAIMKSTGDFIVLMDSDDIFHKDGLKNILKTIAKNRTEESIVFGVSIKKKKKLSENIPPIINPKPNLISLRADYKVTGDLKEVTKRVLLIQCIYPNYGNFTRVPTSWMWSCVAEEADSIIVNKSVVIKEYLPGGMTKNIHQLKAQNPEPLVDLYKLLFKSKRYSSKIFRWRSILLLVRYSFHAKKLKLNNLESVLVVIPALIIFLYDLVLLKINKLR
jgi:glycosyltransferase involved in cell wall biosynthesis